MRSDSYPGGQPERSFIEDARRAQIVGCAVRVLAEVGYARTSLARVAARAGVSKGVISYHFAGKDELLVRVVTSVYEAGAEYIRPRVEAAETASGMLRAYLTANIEYLRDHHEEIVAVTEVVLNLRDPDGRLRFVDDTEGTEPMLAPLRAIFEKGQADGEFRDFDPHTMAWTVRTVIDGINRRRVVEPGLDFDTCVAEVVGLFDHATRSH